MVIYLEEGSIRVLNNQDQMFQGKNKHIMNGQQDGG